jgi:hypothetical protein
VCELDHRQHTGQGENEHEGQQDSFQREISFDQEFGMPRWNFAKQMLKGCCSEAGSKSSRTPLSKKSRYNISGARATLKLHFKLIRARPEVFPQKVIIDGLFCGVIGAPLDSLIFVHVVKIVVFKNAMFHFVLYVVYD